jgi:hypothetical protein
MIEISYSIVVTRNEDGVEDRIELDGYGLYSEALDDLEKMVTQKKWEDRDQEIEADNQLEEEDEENDE